MSKCKWLISVGLIVCLVMTFALPMCAPAPPPPVEEEKPPVEEQLAPYIKAYMSSSPENNLLVVDFIKKELGVEIRQIYMSCGETEAKLKAEAPRFNVDMCIVVCIPQASWAKKEGWAIAYDSPAWRGVGEEFKDPDNNWFNTGNWSMILVGNKDKLAEAGYTLPDSWSDLLDPKWKGEIVMPSPLTSGTAYQMLYSFITLYGFNKDKGEEGGWEYLEALDKNMHHYTRSGSAPAELAGIGEFMLGLTTHSAILARVEKGYPLVWVAPKEGIGYEGTYAFILKGTEKEYTCQKIIDALATLEFANIWGGATGYVTRLPEAPSALFGGELPKYIPNIDHGWACDNKARLLDEWKDRIGRPAV